METLQPAPIVPSTTIPPSSGIGPSRSKLACAACRANKVRCLRNEGLDYACMRCLRYGLACTPPAVNKKRGRPRRTSTNDERAGSDGTPPERPPSNGEAYNSGSMGLISPLVETSHILHFAGNGSTANLAADISVNGAVMHIDPTQPFGANNDRPLGSYTKDKLIPHVELTSPRQSIEAEGSGINKDLDLSEYLDPADPALQGKMEADQPVSLMILSEIEAMSMVQLFHDRLNPLVAVLDAKLHTVQYLRSTSTVLFSTVLAMAARFGRSDLHSLLLSHAQTLLDRAITSGLSEVGVVQAIMILTYWKNPADTSAWRKIGIALRIGYQLYWHVPRTEPLPQDELAARKILNVERTWMCFDRGLSQMYGLPTAIQLNHIKDADSWARDHLYLGPTVDMHLASSIELCKLKDQWRAICESDVTFSAYSDAALESVHAQCEASVRKWWTKELPPPGFIYEKEHVGLWAVYDFMLILKRHRLEAAPTDPGRIDACLSDASRIANEIDILADNGDLEIMQDTSSCMASALCVLLRKIFHLASVTQKSLIITLLQRILVAYTRASGPEVNTATAYVARFFRRTLRAIGTESRVASPLREQLISGNMVAGVEEQPDFMLQLQELMRMPEEVIGQNDDDYWSTLFTI
ncbi:hypothetical protein IAT40_003053 [Kwoniella sp. CBS 6097]